MVGHLLCVEEIGKITGPDPRLDNGPFPLIERSSAEHFEEPADQMEWPAESQTAAALLLQSTQRMEAGMIANRSSGICLPQLMQMP